jgi:hypothetical protein
MLVQFYTTPCGAIWDHERFKRLLLLSGDIAD